MFKEKEKNSTDDLLSVSKNLTMPKTNLELNTESKTISNTLKKQILTIYTDENESMYINRSAAYALGLVNTRAVILNNEDSLVPFSEKQLAIVLNRENIDIEFLKLDQVQQLSERQKIQVFRDNLNNYIEMSSAYALGLISTETFSTMASELYPVSDNLLVFLQSKCDVEFIDLGEKFGSR